MKKIANKTICLLLTLVMLLGVMPLAGIGTFRAKAAEAAEAGEKIVILHTNDVHCALDDAIGYAGLAAYAGALEEQYGAKLFRSQGKQLQLTESGRLFFRTAAAMHHDDLRLREALHQENIRRRLRFGATLTIGEYIMPAPLLRLLEREPDIQLYMRTANTQELLKLLDQGELDFAIVEGYFDKQAYDSLIYCTQRYIPVCASGHPFSPPVRRLEDLLKERLLVREPGSGTRNVLERALEVSIPAEVYDAMEAELEGRDGQE